jgi:hypothetical protein
MTQENSIRSLETTIVDMHAMACGSLSRIRGMARCALFALESPSMALDIERLAEVLQAIAIDAEITHNDVCVEAEGAGTKATDSSRMRRLDARVAARKFLNG